MTDVTDGSISFASNTSAANVAENAAISASLYTPQLATGVATSYSLSGPDSALFNINSSTGQVSFKASPDFERPLDADHNNSYLFNVTATGAGGATAVQAVTLNVTNVSVNSTQVSYDAWLEAEQSTFGVAGKSIEAYNSLSREVVQERSAISRDGSANQTASAKRLTEWVDAVTGTDIVSQQEHRNGFVLTGKAAPGAQGTIQFLLDNNRVGETDMENAKSIPINEPNYNPSGDGPGVSAYYNNVTGEWRLEFAAGSELLRPAVAAVGGSGVHKLVVDTNGSGSEDAAEASRLFLVAGGTALPTDTGTAAQNYSAVDPITKDVFVYYHGDPDGKGVGVQTRYDAQLASNSTPSNIKLTVDPVASNAGLIIRDRDGISNPSADDDYYTTVAATSSFPDVTASNTAMHFVTDIPAQTWEFHANTVLTTRTGAGFAATVDATNDHVLANSNTSRMASLDELVALYAANLRPDSPDPLLAPIAGALQPLTNQNAVGAVASENNTPLSWSSTGASFWVWSTAPTPAGHAVMGFGQGLIADRADTLFSAYAVAVL